MYRALLLLIFMSTVKADLVSLRNTPSIPNLMYDEIFAIVDWIHYYFWVSISFLKQEFPSCIGNSVCGFLQANAKGVSKIPLCNCTTTSECPMNWDPYDGKSITQSASDQYKVHKKIRIISQ